MPFVNDAGAFTNDADVFVNNAVLEESGVFVNDSAFVNDSVFVNNSLTAPPAAPTDLVATARSSGRIDLTWAGSAGTHTVERSIDGGLTWAMRATDLATTEYSDTGLDSSTRYDYRVFTTNPSGMSPYSNVAFATTAAPVDPGPEVVPEPVPEPPIPVCPEIEPPLALGRVRLEAASAGAQWVRFEYHVEDIGEWQTVHDAERVAPVDGVFRAFDWTSIRGRAREYRATAIWAVAGGGEVESQPSLVTPATVPYDGTVRLQSRTDPSKNIAFHHTDLEFMTRSTRPRTIQYAEGRSSPIVRSGRLRLPEFAEGIKAHFVNDDQWYAFLALAKLNEPLLLRTAFGDRFGKVQHWVVLGDLELVEYANDDPGQLRRAVIQAVAVDRPA